MRSGNGRCWQLGMFKELAILIRVDRRKRRGKKKRGIMDISKAQEDIARLEAEANEAQQRFVELMGGMASGESSVDEICAAFRVSGNLQLDIFELRIRIMGHALQSAGFDGLMGELKRSFPMIG